MPNISDWLATNSTRIRVSWDTSGNVMTFAASIYVGYERTWFGIGPFAPAINPEARFVGAYVYTPVAAGDTLGARRFVGSLGSPVPLADFINAITKPEDVLCNFSGTSEIQEKGIIVVFHFLNAAGQILSPSVSLNRIITATSSGNDQSDYLAMVGNTILDSTVTAMQRVGAGLIDQISESTGLDKQTVTVLLVLAGILTIVVVTRR